MTIEVISSKNIQPAIIPIFMSRVQAGRPSAADDDEDDRLSIKDLLVTNEVATFFLRVRGNSMIDANIYDGDILVVDRSLEALHGKVVVAIIDSEFTVKRLFNKDGVVKLMPENPDFPEITFQDMQELKVWGVVTYVIHKV